MVQIKKKGNEGFLQVLGLATYLVMEYKRKLCLGWLLWGTLGRRGRLAKLWGPWAELSLAFPYQMGTSKSNLVKTFSFFNFSNISKIFNRMQIEKIKKTEGFL